MKQIITAFLFFAFFLTFGQQKEIVINQFIHFQITEKSDTIDFIVADTSLIQKKPIFIFCQGSMPVPLFIDFGKQGIYNVGGGISNFDLTVIKQHYHLVVISMPKTPLVVSYDHVNNSYSYIPDTTRKNQLGNEFYKADFLNNYKNRVNTVINYLIRQKWADKSQLIIAGHSQGSKVALKVAGSNKYVTKLGLFGFNPFGRIDQYIRQARKDAEFGRISWAIADSIIESQFQPRPKTIPLPDIN